MKSIFGALLFFNFLVAASISANVGSWSAGAFLPIVMYDGGSECQQELLVVMLRSS
jgi:hypothetical protein